MTGRGGRTPGRRPWEVREYNDGDGHGDGHGDDGGDHRHHDDDDGDDDDIDDVKERGTHLVCCLGQRQNKTTDCYLISTCSYCPLSHMVVCFMFDQELTSADYPLRVVTNHLFFYICCTPERAQGYAFIGTIIE